VNKHGGHTANCLCCAHLELESGFAGSTVTAPGSDSYKCARKHFDMAWADMPTSMHREFQRAETCEDFEGRQS